MDEARRIPVSGIAEHSSDGRRGSGSPAFGGGAFAKHVAQAQWTEIQVSLEDAATATTSQVNDLVRYVRQSNPEIISQLLNTLAADPTMIAAVGASIAALTIRQRSHPGRKNQAPAD